MSQTGRDDVDAGAMHEQGRADLSRRAFLQSTAAVGLAFAPRAGAQEPAAASGDEVRAALIGGGTQGQLLLNTALKLPGIRFTAICDIWTAFNQRMASAILREAAPEHRVYDDYRAMLSQEKDLDAVFIATPDFCHAEQTIACLEAGLHVYCETPMSNTIEGGRAMVRAARAAGKVLQIGQQRRSNPRYLHCVEKLLGEVRLLGRITAANAQWNRPVQPDRGWPRRAPMDEATLERYGFESMPQFRNWRWYKGLGTGPLGELGPHQLDIMNWFLGARPKTILASGGTDYYEAGAHQWPDTILAILEYETRRGPVRASYQIVSMNSNMRWYEKFLGDEGCLVISEVGGFAGFYREEAALDWDRWVDLGYLTRPDRPEPKGDEEKVVAVADTTPPPRYGVPFPLEDPYHAAHVANFVTAARGAAPPRCPAEVGFEALVTALKIGEALEKGGRVELTDADFQT